MTIRYEHHQESTVNLTGGPFVTFPAGVVEVDLDDPDRERRIVEHYEAVELVEEPESDDGSELCGAIKTNGEPCDRLAEECRWHGEDDEDDGESEAEAEDEDAETEQIEQEPEQCGVEMSDGSLCDRPADECRYHADDNDD